MYLYLCTYTYYIKFEHAVKNRKKIPTLAHFCMKFLKYISKTLIENLLSFELLAPSWLFLQNRMFLTDSGI